MDREGAENRNIPPPVKASPSPVCLRRPVSLRDASSAPRLKNAWKSVRSRPSSSLGKDLRSEARGLKSENTRLRERARRRRV